MIYNCVLCSYIYIVRDIKSSNNAKDDNSAAIFFVLITKIRQCKTNSVMSSSVNFTKLHYMRKIYVKSDRYLYCIFLFELKSIRHDIKSKKFW